MPVVDGIETVDVAEMAADLVAVPEMDAVESCTAELEDAETAVELMAVLKMILMAPPPPQN
jgi:hypothetical protein